MKKPRRLLIAGSFLLLAFSECDAKSTHIELVCTIQQGWIDSLIKVSKNRPRPTPEFIIKTLKDSGIYEIRVSFDDNDLGMGMGVINGHAVLYHVTESAVLFMTGEPATHPSDMSIIDRRTGTLFLNFKPNFNYDCKKLEKQF